MMIPCAVPGCGQEECATVHKVNDANGGHDYLPVSTFEVEYQRRLRAVLSARTGRTMPEDTVVTVDIEGWTEDYGGDTGSSTTVSLTLRGVTPAGITVGTSEREGEGAFAALMADLMAVPEVTP